MSICGYGVVLSYGSIHALILCLIHVWVDFWTLFFSWIWVVVRSCFSLLIFKCMVFFGRFV